MMVVTQSRFHRDRLDGEQIALKPLTFHREPNLQTMQLGGALIQPVSVVASNSCDDGLLLGQRQLGIDRQM
jgi:hypothetical protein